MKPLLSRRAFLGRAPALGASLGLLPRTLGASDAGAPLPTPTARQLPPWRGFNLLAKFDVGNQTRFQEPDFATIAGLGFNFARLPMDYRCWTEPGNRTRFRPDTLAEIDEAVRFGTKHNVHVCLNFHRAPGYSVADPPEPRLLWTDDDALRACARHWKEFARRYHGIPSRQLSFNLLNEPAHVEAEPHRRAIAHLVAAIREQDPDRLLICDGRDWGHVAPGELANLGVAAATRGYQPFKLTHFLAPWANDQGRWETPTYPLKDGDTLWDKARLREVYIEPWRRLQSQGVGVMVGEFGAYHRTPHAVVLAWLRDMLSLWQEAGWGWALWMLEGPFGVLDSDRSDVNYEAWQGHKLDRAFLKLLQSSLPLR